MLRFPAVLVAWAEAVGGRVSWIKPVVAVRPGKPIVGFWHIGALGDWRRIVDEQYAKLKDSGLYEASETIVVGFIGGRSRLDELGAALPDDPKFEVFTTEDVEDYEFPTLVRLWHEARRRERSFFCYYFHTKGVSRGEERQINAWRRYMEYFTLERWEDCVLVLADHDTCGVELKDDGHHYSGNFWWATSDYVRTLPDADRFWREHRDDRLAAERYVCLARPRAHCFHNLAENLYDYEILPQVYRR